MFTAKEAFEEAKKNRDFLFEFRFKRDTVFIDKWIKKNVRAGRYEVWIPWDRLTCNNEKERKLLFDAYEARGFKIEFRYKEGWGHYVISWEQEEEQN